MSSGHTNESYSLWEDGEDFEDDTMSRNSKENARLSELDKIQALRSEIERRTLDSASRSVNMLHEAELTGIATTEELSIQHEKLRNTNLKLDEINEDLKITQTHINGMKSMFNGFWNVFRGKKNEPPMSRPNSLAQPERESCTTARNASANNSYDAHPMAHLRADFQTEDNRPAPTGKSFQEKLGDNLDLMNEKITALKGIGTAMTSEIEVQNVMLDEMSNKVEIVGQKLESQKRDMDQLLK